MPKPSCVIATAVWGDWHVGAFLDLNLPTMIASGNIPALARRVDAIYTIYTTLPDWRRICADPAFARLREFVDVRFSALSARDIGTPVETHHDVWRKAIEDASGSGAYVILMPPDIVWADGSLRHLAELMQAGKKAIFLNWHVRSVQDTFVQDFRQRYRKQDDAISIPARELVRLSFEHVHPIVGASLRDSTHFPHHPEMIFWPVAGEGLLMRVLALVPFVFRPDLIQLTPQRTVAAALEPSEAEFVVDSDDLYLVSLAEIGKDADWYKNNIALDAAKVARWWLYFDSPMNDALADASYRLHFSELTPQKWRAAECEARFCIHRLIASREVLRIRQAAERIGCHRVAHVLDYVLAARLAPAIVGHRKRLAVFIPDDDAFAGRERQIEEMLQPSRHRELIYLLRAHLLPLEALPAEATQPAGPAHFTSESGDPIELRTGLIHAATGTEVKAVMAAGPHLLFPIPKLLAAPYPGRLAVLRKTPDEIGRALVDAIKEGAPAATLDKLTDGLRQRGIESSLIRNLLAGLDQPPGDYQGFDHLRAETREKLLRGDAWHWHRKWLKSALPEGYKARLAIDLLLTTQSEQEIRRLESMAIVPAPIMNAALGRLALDGKRVSEAVARFRTAGKNPVNGLVMRSAGEAAYRSGDGQTANEWFHMCLHTSRDFLPFDVQSKKPAGAKAGQPELHLIDYYGTDYHTNGNDFFAVTGQIASSAPRGPIGGVLLSWLRIWLRNTLPRRWVERLRKWALQFAAWRTQRREALSRLLFVREIHGRGRNLLQLTRQARSGAKRT